MGYCIIIFTTFVFIFRIHRFRSSIPPFLQREFPYCHLKSYFCYPGSSVNLRCKFTFTVFSFMEGCIFRYRSLLQKVLPSYNYYTLLFILESFTKRLFEYNYFYHFTMFEGKTPVFIMFL